MKIIKIHSCSECPYLNWFGYHGTCRETDKTINDENKIPEWCPLKEGK